MRRAVIVPIVCAALAALVVSSVLVIAVRPFVAHAQQIVTLTFTRLVYDPNAPAHSTATYACKDPDGKKLVDIHEVGDEVWLMAFIDES
jgi:hypothetical protein